MKGCQHKPFTRKAIHGADSFWRSLQRVRREDGDNVSSHLLLCLLDFLLGRKQLKTRRGRDGKCNVYIGLYRVIIQQADDQIFLLLVRKRG